MTDANRIIKSGPVGNLPSNLMTYIWDIVNDKERREARWVIDGRNFYKWYGKFGLASYDNSLDLASADYREDLYELVSVHKVRMIFQRYLNKLKALVSKRLGS